MCGGNLSKIVPMLERSINMMGLHAKKLFVVTLSSILSVLNFGAYAEVVFHSDWESGKLLDNVWSGERSNTGSEHYVISGVSMVHSGNYAREVKWYPGYSAGGGQDCTLAKHSLSVPGKDYYVRFYIWLGGDPISGSVWKNTGQKKAIYETIGEHILLDLGTRYMDNDAGYYRSWFSPSNEYYSIVGGPICGLLHMMNGTLPSSGVWNTPNGNYLDLHHDWYTMGTPVPGKGIYLYEGKWYCVEKFVHKSPTEGEIRLWVDGKEIIRANRKTFGTSSYKTGEEIPTDFYLDSYFNDYNSLVNQVQYERTDDFVISTTYVGPMDLRPPVVSGYNDNGDGTFSVHITDVDSGVNPASIRLKVRNTENVPFVLEGTPVDYKLTASAPSGIAYTEVAIAASDLGTDNDYDGTPDPNHRGGSPGTYVVVDSLALDSDGEGTADFVGGDNDGDWLPHPDKFDQNYAPEFDLSNVGPEDVFPQHAWLATVGRLNIDVDGNDGSQSDGIVSNRELVNYVKMYHGDRGEVQLPELLMAASWWAGKSSDMQAPQGSRNPNGWRWKDWEAEGAKLNLKTSDTNIEVFVTTVRY